MSRIGMQELAAVLSKKRRLTKEQAENFVNNIFEVLNQGLETDRVAKIKGLGTFKLNSVRNRESVNVNTGERVVIEGHDKLVFTPEAMLRDMINKPFAQFETVLLNDGVDFAEMESTVDAVDEDIASDDTEIESEVDETLPDNTEENIADIEQIQTESEDVPVKDEDESVSEDSVSSEETKDKRPDACIEAAEEPSDGTLLSGSEEVDNVEVEVEYDNVISSDNEGDILESSSEGEDVEETKGVSLSKAILFSAVFFIIAIAAGALGYYFGTLDDKDTTGESIKHPAIVSETIPKKQAAKQVQTGRDTVSSKPTISDVQETSPISVTTSAEEDAKKTKQKEQTATVESKKKVEKQTVSQPSEDYDRYARSDARVRTGAYRIVGVERTVKVKAGETLKGISDRHLGPGMECYVEALNGVKTVKAGDVLKIPKVKLKKAKTR